MTQSKISERPFRPISFISSSGSIGIIKAPSFHEKCTNSPKPSFLSPAIQNKFLPSFALPIFLASVCSKHCSVEIFRKVSISLHGRWNVGSLRSGFASGHLTSDCLSMSLCYYPMGPILTGFLWIAFSRCSVGFLRFRHPPWSARPFAVVPSREEAMAAIRQSQTDSFTEKVDAQRRTRARFWAEASMPLYRPGHEAMTALESVAKIWRRGHARRAAQCWGRNGSLESGTPILIHPLGAFSVGRLKSYSFYAWREKEKKGQTDRPIAKKG